MSRGISDKTKKLTVGAVLSAIGVVLLLLGTLVEVLDLTMAALASFCCIFAVIEMGTGYAWMIYAVTGLISLVMMPQGVGGWIYALFFGYYPIVKCKFEKLKAPLAWLLKLLSANVAVTAYALISYFVFFGQSDSLIDEISQLTGLNSIAVIIAVVYIVINVVFVVYDLALSRIIGFYFVKLRKKFRFIGK